MTLHGGNTMELDHLRLAAVNIDGVMLNDTFSPVIHHFITSRGGTYTAESERGIFSQPQRIAFQRLAAAVGSRATVAEMREAYFQERAEYLETHPVALTDGAVELLQRLRALGLRTVCYGGLEKAHFDSFLGEHAALFDGPGYVCTNDFRPGIHEITTEVFGLRYDQALFIDDVARVAETARTLGVPFIGHPSSFQHSFQEQLMREAGTRHLVRSLPAIDDELLRAIDAEAATGAVWSDPAAV
ncbi:HAD family hydrolase [Streptomyces sp. NBC_00344]|uniref:HAD family hydrolase n=1 Tax=Streptomyces sp. NBC_00344 TaxID=2975720 RepID=UPI002E1CEC97